MTAVTTELFIGTIGARLAMAGPRTDCTGGWVPASSILPGRCVDVIHAARWIIAASAPWEGAAQCARRRGSGRAPV